MAAGMLDSPVPYEYDFLNYDGQVYSTIDSHWPHVLGELGLLGFAAYCWFLWAAGRNSWRLSSRRDVSPFARILGATAAVFLLIVAIEAFAAPNFEDTLLGFMLFSLLGFTQFPSADTNDENDPPGESASQRRSI
jgi:hypothetical protein